MPTFVDLPYGFSSRPYQKEVQKAIFVDGKKHIIQVMHRRSGKTINNLNICCGLVYQRVGLHLYTFPKHKQARKVIWNGFDNEGRKYLDYFPSELIKRVDNQEMYIEFKNGSIFQLCGTDNYDALVGTNPVSITYDEYPLQNPMARLYLRPIMSQNEGIEIFCYTPRGRNHGYKLYQANKNNPDWYCTCMGIDKTVKDDGSPVIPYSEVEILRAEGMPEELIQQEYYCSFDVEMPGSVFGSWINAAQDSGRIRDIPIDKNVPVFTWWDIGYNDETVIVFMQPSGGELRFIDCYHNRTQGLPHYCEYIKQFAQKNQIQYKHHFPPHDIEVHDFGNGLKRIQIAASHGVQFEMPSPKIVGPEGRESLRALLPRCHFDKTRCETLIDALRDYRHDFDSKNNAFKSKPIHDWTSHFADAMQYFALTWQQHFASETKSHPLYRYVS